VGVPGCQSGLSSPIPDGAELQLLGAIKTRRKHRDRAENDGDDQHYSQE